MKAGRGLHLAIRVEILPTVTLHVFALLVLGRREEIHEWRLRVTSAHHSCFVRNLLRPHNSLNLCRYFFEESSFVSRSIVGHHFLNGTGVSCISCMMDRMLVPSIHSHSKSTIIIFATQAHS